MNVVDPILFQCRQNPPAVAICAPGTVFNIVSYARLEQFINNIGHRALAAGIRLGNIVAIMVKDHIFHASMALALARIGAATLSVSDLRLPMGLRVDAVITDARALVGNPANLPIIPADFTWTEGDGKHIEDRFVSPGDGEVARIVLTSGSTGMPKAIAVTHALEMRRIERYAYVFGATFAECSRVFSDMGLGQSTSFRMLIYVLGRGGTFLFPGGRTDGFAANLRALQGSGPSGVPWRPERISKILRSKQRVPTRIQRHRDDGCPITQVVCPSVSGHGSGQISCSFLEPRRPPRSPRPPRTWWPSPGAVGRVVPGVTVEIVDAEQRVLPQGAEGFVRVRSPTMVDGYLGDPEQTRVSFRDGYFHSGDLGYLTKRWNAGHFGTLRMRS